MKTKKQPKSFDAVKMTRQIRDKITAETQGMNFEQMKAYIAERLKTTKFKLLPR
ncbi:MAG TPA: hypothetical protein VFD13_07230 [Candidatus Kapabacteria bacterium]|nr:hypothetical protein [Candidatus Kapabacteria bacterium]